MEGELRAYFFGNMYLSSIQQGIQAGHVISELFVKYPHPPAIRDSHLLWDWAENHKTVVLLNGGYSSELLDIIQFFSHRDNPYPWTSFCEADDALDGALTCVGIILPEQIFLTSKFIRERTLAGAYTNLIAHINLNGKLLVPKDHSPTGEEILWEYTKWQFQLADRLNNYRLAQ